MPNILTKEISSTHLSPLDALAVAGSKIVTENFLSRVPFVGNGTIRSGIVKLIGAFALTGLMKNKIGGYVGTGLMVDAGEDLVTGIFGVRSGTSQSTVVGGANANQGAGIGSVI